MSVYITDSNLDKVPIENEKTLIYYDINGDIVDNDNNAYASYLKIHGKEFYYVLCSPRLVNKQFKDRWGQISRLNLCNKNCFDYYMQYLKHNNEAQFRAAERELDN